MDAVAQCAAPAAGACAAGGLAAQPVFIFQPVEGGLYRVIRGQVAPLIAAHIAQREAVFEFPAFELGRQSLRRAQPVIFEQPIAAPRMGFQVLAPGRRAQRRFLRDGAADAPGRAVHQMKRKRQRRKQLVEFRQMLPDKRRTLAAS
jgi:hypothetical protein